MRSKDKYRSAGAIIGLVIGFLLVYALGRPHIAIQAILGAGGAVLGGMSGESLFAKRNRQ
jgi:uncharacterized protein YcfJ